MKAKRPGTERNAQNEKEMEDRAFARGAAKAILRVLSQRNLDVPMDVRAKIAACTDLAQIELWLDLAATARSAYQVIVDIRETPKTMGILEWLDAIGEGHAMGTADAIIRILKKRRLRVSVETRDRIKICKDRKQLKHWLDRALTTTSAQELFDR